ncbi:uncharacterized protein LOC130735250 [Lotus japonicus]|uniref:uncharacterized protein LOC130735250 n=1 Tax=Lotus japonicus TaxID=34305 RepID=UPI0025866EDC|nr:uncharacterized protein LOC130735250 [Lotus japonicus]
MSPKGASSSSGTKKRQMPIFKNPSKQPIKEEESLIPINYNEHEFGLASNEKYYNEIVANAQMINERSVSIPSGKDSWGIGAAIVQRRWSVVLCKPAPLGCANLVTEFYANAQFDSSIPTPSEPTYKSYCKGVVIDYSPDTIRRFLKLSFLAVEARIFGTDKPNFHFPLNNTQRRRF